MGLSPLHTVLRLLPMFISGTLCNVLVAFVVGRIQILYLIGLSVYQLIQHCSLNVFAVFGTMATNVACLLFALIIPSAPYWAFGFPAAIISVIGADFIFASGTLFIAKVSLPHEQSVGGALFSTMTQVRLTQFNSRHLNPS